MNEIDQLCTTLENRMSGDLSLEEKVSAAVDFLSQSMAVDENEVAVFLLDERKTVLHFLWPERLKQIGFIPYSSIDSLAARTAREGRVFLNNTFASHHHASFFEKIRLKEGSGDRPLPIQKIISVPMLAGEEVRGVIQISRKGTSEEQALADFTDADAGRLIEFAAIIGRVL